MSAKKMLAYDKVGTSKAGNQGDKEFFKQTLSRLEQVQKQFTGLPRSGRLQGKVCIITGVGSVKGIGYVAK